MERKLISQPRKMTLTFVLFPSPGFTLFGFRYGLFHLNR